MNIWRVLQKHYDYINILNVKIKLKEICDEYCKNTNIVVAFSPLESSLHKSVRSIATTPIL